MAAQALAEAAAPSVDTPADAPSTKADCADGTNAEAVAEAAEPAVETSADTPGTKVAGTDATAAEVVADKEDGAEAQGPKVTPVLSLAPPADDSSDDGVDEDGLPVMGGGFGYWSQMLNVTKVADPLPPPPPKAEAPSRPPRPRGPNAFNAFGDSWRGSAAGGSAP